jgi:hypothetical protein
MPEDKIDSAIKGVTGYAPTDENGSLLGHNGTLPQFVRELRTLWDRLASQAPVPVPGQSGVLNAKQQAGVTAFARGLHAIRRRHSTRSAHPKIWADG